MSLLKQPTNPLAMMTPSHSSNSIGGLTTAMDALSVSRDSRGSERTSVAGNGISASQRAMGISRRSSAYSSRPSLAASTGPTKEVRPIRDKQWQNSAIRNLISFLVQMGYPESINPKMLSPPTQKDFQSVFRFTYMQLDPTYNYTKKFEEEVPAILKGLRYPFVEQITKNHIISVGTMHAWPHMLAMLTWLVELVMCVKEMENEDIFLDNETEDEAVIAEKEFFEFLQRSYHRFMSDDSYEDMDDDLAQQKNMESAERLEKLKNDNEILSKELRDLTSKEPPLKEAQGHHGILLSDKGKFMKYIDHLEEKKEKLIAANASITEEIQQKEMQLKILAQKKEDLSNQVNEQPISVEAVKEMKSQIDQLRKSVRELEASTANLRTKSWDNELKITKKVDNLEMLAKQFNDLAHELRILSDDTSLNAPTQTFNNTLFSGDVRPLITELELNIHGTRVEKVFSLDLKNGIKPMLAKLKQQYNKALFNAQEESNSLQEALDNLTDQNAERLDEIEALKSRIIKTDQKFEEMKQSTKLKTSNMNAEIEALEQKVSFMRKENESMWDDAIKRETQAKAEFEKFERQVEATRKQMLLSMHDSLSYVVEFRQTVTRELEDLLEFFDDDFKEVLKMEEDGRRYADSIGVKID
ncbi:kinetochore-associated Ndc80 complex subunit ndc80 [Nowakowskiella sp. JEL0407]|nr:kinetochore-associated Ndc80 complex subunit ndc80 [Nowakowskiella sp. JEL0407]